MKFIVGIFSQRDIFLNSRLYIILFLMNFKKLNTLIGWTVFAIATSVYLMTMESTASLWDCGEYITAAYKLEVGHPPGAPLFMVLGRLFSFFAAPDSVALWINALSAVSSSLTILFMFWSMSLLLKKLVQTQKGELGKSDGIMVLVASGVAALAYTFSDSFWFSAVEGEVYAMASLFTAVIFWAALKWDEEMNLVENHNASPNRWILIIFFMLGLAVGVHLLGILVVPAIGYLIYFNVSKKITWVWFILTGVISVFALGFIQEGIIPGSIALASSFEVSFVNSFGLPFFSGTIFFFIILISGCVFAVRYARKKQHTILYNAIMGLTVLLIGYGSFAVIVIRSNANTPLDENDPENLVTLHSYLKREQYGSNPIFFGQYWNSFRLNETLNENGQPQLTSKDGWGDLSPYYLRRFVVQEGENDVKAFIKEADAKAWMTRNKGAYTLAEKYYESNSSIRIGAEPAYAQTTIFPRMYAETPQHINGYKEWSGYDPADGAGEELGRDGMRLPTMGENLTYLFRYQVNWMYMRYLLWNFSGRQNDIQGHGDNLRGNWISGIDWVDTPHVGPSDAQPFYTSENPAHNRFFLIPFAFIILGIFFHFYRAPKDAFVLTLAFLFTGLAIVVYLNQKPLEPRERDYAYSGSFYFFAMWLAFGVYALYDFISSLDKKMLLKLSYYLGGGLLLFFLFGYGRLWITTVVIIGVMTGLAYALKQIKLTSNVSVLIISALGLLSPLLMGSQGWDDHDRSGKTSARDLAYNYLNSCKKNGILFTNGDNDTFPLWYLQEVEGKRTDVRVCNLSLMGTDWYTNQMKMKAYDSDPLPIEYREDQILMYAGNTDQVYFLPLLELSSLSNDEALLKKVIDLRLKKNKTIATQVVNYFNGKMGMMRGSFSVTQPNLQGAFDKTWSQVTSADTLDLSKNIIGKFTGINQIFQSIQQGAVKIDEGAAKELQTLFDEFEKPWMSVDLTDAMEFVRKDENFIIDRDGNHINFFPSSKFYLNVNKQNAVASQIINKGQLSQCANEIEFSFNEDQDRYLTRDEVMMMDIVANNDWKRGIYFSSNRGSSFSLALLNGGWVKQVGMAYVVSPIKTAITDFYDRNEMFRTISSVFQYGDMANPDVLTDYYARRHTTQFRANFLILAEQFYLQKNTKKAIALLDQSLQVMPLETVLDFGEVNACDPMNMLTYNQNNRSYLYADQEIRAKCSGNLNEHVQLYYLCKATKKGALLGNKLMDQYETVLNYYEKAPIELSSNIQNTEDLYAVTDAIFKMYITLEDPMVHAENSAFGKRLKKNIDRIYKKILPSMSSKLIALGNDNGEDARMGIGVYGQRFDSITGNLKAIGEHYGYLPKSVMPNAEPAPNTTLPMMQGQ